MREKCRVKFLLRTPTSSGLGSDHSRVNNWVEFESAGKHEDWAETVALTGMSKVMVVLALALSGERVS